MKEEARKNRTTGRLGSKGQGDSLGSAARLDYAKREIVAARFFEIPAEAVTLNGENVRLGAKG